MRRLELFLTSPRFYKDLGVGFFCALVCLFFVMWIGVPNTSTLPFGENAVVSISVDSSIVLSDFQCTTMHWEARNATLQLATVSDDLPSQGSVQVCSQESFVLNILVDGKYYTYYPIIWINPYHLASCILFFVVFLMILKRPSWLGGYWWEAVFIGFVVIVYAIYLLFDREGRFRHYYTAVSFGFSVAGIALTYIYRRNPGYAFRVLCLIFLTIILATRFYQMFFKPELLTYDERFYLSIAATASGGHGLYPSLQDFPPMPVMGGIGHLAWLYVLAYQVLGPSLYSIRVVVFLVGLLGLPPIFLLFRRWYGSAMGWLAVALLPATYLYVFAFSARMDIFVVTCLWWALLLIDVAREKKRWYWHLAAGLWIGFCLQAHIHTSIMAIAFGLLYVIDYGRQVRQTGRWSLPSAVLLYSLGALVGLGFYVVFNILPDPDAFFRTAGNAARFDEIAVNSEMSLPDRLIRSLTAVNVFWNKFVLRLAYILDSFHPLELIVWIMACFTLFYRGLNRAALTTVILSASAVVVGFFILNNESLLYTIHISPPLLLFVPPFILYGFSHRRSFDWLDITPCFLLVLSVYLLPTYMVGFYPPVFPSLPAVDPSSAAAIVFVKEHISTECSLAGPHNIFVYNLPMYGLYYSPQHISFGLGYYSTDTETDIWQALAPDVVLDIDSSKALTAWIKTMDYEEIFPDIWKKTHRPLSPDCVIAP